MFIIEIKRRYKFTYVIYKNHKNEIARFNTKKEARDYIFKLSQYFRKLDRQQNVFNYTPILLRNCEALSLYYEIRPTLGDTFSYEGKDYFTVHRIVNNN